MSAQAATPEALQKEPGGWGGERGRGRVGERGRGRVGVEVL